MSNRFARRLLLILTVPTVKRLWLKRIVGFENIPPAGPCIAISNHASYLDFLILGTLFDGIADIPLHFLANLKVSNHPIFRFYVKYFDSIPTDPQRPAGSWRRSLRYLKEGRYLGIFPEGTRSRTGKLGEFNLGYLRLASAVGVPILPIVIHNTFAALPPHRKIPRLSKCTIEIHKPITIQRGLSKAELIDLNDKVFQEYYAQS